MSMVDLDQRVPAWGIGSLAVSQLLRWDLSNFLGLRTSEVCYNVDEKTI
jgi:hypothetical protein